jgi:hypothetical protein
LTGTLFVYHILNALIRQKSGLSNGAIHDLSARQMNPVGLRTAV